MNSKFICILLIASLLAVSVNATQKLQSLKKKSQVALTTTGPALATGSNNLFFACSGPAKDATWTYNQGFVTVKCAGTGNTYLGGYGAGGVVTSPAFSLSKEQGVIISCKVAFMDSWDGESFQIKANGAVVYSAASNWQTRGTSNSCGTAGWNDAYSNVKFGFNTTASTLTIVVTSTLDQAADDESWGICDLTITPSQWQVLADGTEMVIQPEFIKATPNTWFPCVNPTLDWAWTYVPTWTTVKCAGTGNTYVGGFGAGGKVVSPTFNVDPHNGILVNMKVAFMDSWDGEAFQVKADGNLVYSATSNWQTRGGTNSCGNAGWNDAYSNVQFGFNNTADKVTFTITSTLDQAANDESWGFCDFTVSATRYPLLADGTPVTTEALSQSVIWFSCKGPEDDLMWNYVPAFSTIKCAGTGNTYLGPYGAGGQATSPKLLLDSTHQGLIISAKIAFMDSWDGESFQIKADNTLVYSAASNWQTRGTSNSCGTAGWNDAYSSVTFGFNHTGPSVTFTITSTLDQAADDESWGVCDFTVTPSQWQVLADGTEMVIVPEFVTGKPTVWFACKGPARDFAWSYSPAWSTIKCAGTGYTYVGPYGQGGVVTSPQLTVDPHYGIIVSLKLAFIDSWDGEAFQVKADGNLVYAVNHNFQTQSPSNTCGNGWNDAYANVQFGFNHTAGQVVFTITSTLDQAASDEAWGICDLTISSTTNLVNADGTIIKTQPIGEAATLWFPCKKVTQDDNWSYYPAFTTITCAGTGYNYLGPYGAGGRVTSPALAVGAHNGILVSTKVAFMDSWDGEAFQIKADGNLVYSATSNWQTRGTSNSCGTGVWNDAYSAVTFGFNHTAGTLSLVVTSTLDQAASDESWGICDFTVSASKFQYLADGTPITTETLGAGPSVWFACGAPQNDILWTYNPAFSTIKCAGTGYTYLGPYGQGGVVTSPKLFVSTSHQGITVSFKLAWIDSWDGEAFKISADGNLVYSATHNFQTQSPSNTCGNGWNDAYSTITFGFNHSAPSVTFTITSTLDQAASDEAWGICDFTVSASIFTLLADGTPITTQAISDQPTVWFPCTNPSNNLLWTYTPSFSTIKCAGTGYTYLGPYGQGGAATSPVLTIGIPHQSIIVSLKLAFIDSWDGEAFQVKADGNLVYAVNHNFQTQSPSNTCGNGWNDAYANVQFGFNQTGPTVKLTITSTLDQAADDEAWGICDLTVTTSKYQALADGTLITTEAVTDKPSVWFPCSNPTIDILWTYYPAFTTIKCAGTGYTYVGPYGQGGVVTSPNLVLTLPHQGLLVSAKIAFMDSWDGESFQIKADGAVVYAAASNWQTRGTSNSCGTAGWNDAYGSASFGFNHSNPTVKFTITSTLDQAADDESWGVCDFTVSSTAYKVLADGTPIKVEPIGAQPTVWFACSGPQNDILWTYFPAFSTIKCAGTGYTYLGPYGAQGTATSPTLQADAHNGITVSLKLAWIDSWDGEAFQIRADGNLVYSATHSVLSQSFSNTCGNGWNDAYANIVLGFNHTANTLKFVISSTLDQAASDEAWGICDFTVTTSPFPLLADGTPLTAGYLTGANTVYFPCTNPTKLSDWVYYPAFSTIKCAGTGFTYVGPYGAGGYVNSPSFQFTQAHKGLVVSVKIAFMDSWDGESFQIKADGNLVYAAASNWQTRGTGNSCGTSGWNDAYGSANFGFNHTASSVKFTFTSSLDQDVSDESWGICDLTIRATQNPVNAGGAEVGVIAAIQMESTTTCTSSSCAVAGPAKKKKSTGGKLRKAHPW